MYKIWTLICLSLLLVLGGCASTQNALQVLNSTQVTYPGPPQLTPNSERILEQTFLETGMSWDSEMVTAIAMERNALAASKDHLDSLLMTSTSISYYIYRAKVEETSYHFYKLISLLDDRATTPGALTDQGFELYTRIKQDVMQELTWQKERLSIETSNINKQATSMDIADLKNVYETLKPLYSIAKGLL